MFGAIKKSGKTTLAAIVMLTMVLLYGGRFAEGYCVANDLEQAQSRVFAMVKRIIEASPLLRGIAKLTADRVTFPALGATIIAIASDAASAAGANPTISCFDELWGYVVERSRRLWDEMITSPGAQDQLQTDGVATRVSLARACLLEEIYKRGMALPEVGPSLHAGEGMLFAWHTEPIAPWQTEAWLAEMRRSLRPNAYARMICNEFVSRPSRSSSTWRRGMPACSPSLDADVRSGCRSGLGSTRRRSVTAPRSSPSPSTRRPRWCAWCSIACSRRPC